MSEDKEKSNKKLIIGLIIAIKYIPVWLTILNLVIFTAGFAAGWLFNKKKDEYKE